MGEWRIVFLVLIALALGGCATSLRCEPCGSADPCSPCDPGRSPCASPPGADPEVDGPGIPPTPAGTSDSPRTAEFLKEVELLRARGFALEGRVEEMHTANEKSELVLGAVREEARAAQEAAKGTQERLEVVTREAAALQESVAQSRASESAAREKVREMASAAEIRGAELEALKADFVTAREEAAQLREQAAAGNRAASEAIQDLRERLPASDPDADKRRDSREKGLPVWQKVYYATDREGITFDFWWLASRFLWAAIAAIAAVLAIVFLEKEGFVRIGFMVLLSGLCLFLTAKGVATCIQASDEVERFGTRYGSAWSDELELGVLEISIPWNRPEASVPTENIFHLELYPDPEKHFALQKLEIREENEFYEELRRDLATPPPDDEEEEHSTAHDAFVFVHGYNNSFRAAAFRTAQIAHDLEFDGAAICYSWPSQGGSLAGVAGYTKDEAQVEKTFGHLRAFLKRLAAEMKAAGDGGRLHLIAHSMGNRALTNALQRLGSGFDGEPPFDQVVLAAPDITLDVFRSQIAGEIQKTAEDVTLYCCKSDGALFISKVFHLDEERVGERPLFYEGILTVDVSDAASGHSYLTSDPDVLKDLEHLFDGVPPDDRDMDPCAECPDPERSWWVLR